MPKRPMEQYKKRTRGGDRRNTSRPNNPLHAAERSRRHADPAKDRRRVELPEGAQDQVGLACLHL